MRSLFMIVLTLMLCPMVAQADLSMDRLHAQLVTRDFDALDRDLADAHAAALASRDFRDLRSAYATLFVAANDDRLHPTRAWAKARPTSPYATTALGWMLYRRAFQLRGDGYWNSLAPETQATFVETMTEASLQVEAALAVRDDFLPAIDLAILLRQAGFGNRAPVALMNRALGIAPGRHVISLTLDALHPRWGGSAEQMFAVCDGLTGDLRGYDRELCQLEANFMLVWHIPDWSPEAIAALERRPEPILDGIRLQAYMSVWAQRPEAGRIAADLLRGQMGCNANARYMRDAARLIDIRIRHSSDLIAEIEQAQLQISRNCLRGEPQNVDLAVSAIAELLRDPSGNSPGPRSDITRKALEAGAIWQEALPLGQYRADYWAAYGDIAVTLTDGRGVETEPRYLNARINAVHFSNYDPTPLRRLRDAYFDTAYDGVTARLSRAGAEKRAAASTALCPMFRAARLLEAACAHQPQSPDCEDWVFNSEGQTQNQVIDEMAKVATVCQWERTAPLEQLLYTPIPATAFRPPSQ
ncbi:DUF4034 domain-containing protein [Gemmobacter caeruleus]|uniref:DUF4034 domain-containing protein n=1 Tax=Gemmobacter caeruleus TaxID=2595004 RepID=UPI001396C7EE|nr:DUF4034 domain-containing protein [Gemmobacter caeruleus]